ncbi:hypothetical protein CesoFtcFv8_022587 [Champsocephalus esox]|uniref:Uncharacterized protein n=1 Tax=Champsocephalus esox TaxID=159716 RepID=A0AAN8B6M3_9TELE|nr:hypothetical protein CesoFtcFv8_022587 [Champsocephalus esox]
MPGFGSGLCGVRPRPLGASRFHQEIPEPLPRLRQPVRSAVHFLFLTWDFLFLLQDSFLPQDFCSCRRTSCSCRRTSCSSRRELPFQRRLTSSRSLSEKSSS